MKLWLTWALASTVGFGLGGRLGRTVSPSEDIMVIGYLALALSLVFVALLQWLILRPLIASTGWWVAASIVGVGILGVTVYGAGLLNRDVGWVVGAMAGWVLLGVFQWLVLRETVAGAGWWVAAHALALVLAGPGVGFVTWLTGAPVDTSVGNLLRWIAFGAVYGAVTGSALCWLLRERLSLAT